MTRVECNVLNFSSYEGTESVTQDQLFEISQSHLLKSFFLSLDRCSRFARKQELVFSHRCVTGMTMANLFSSRLLEKVVL